MGKTSYICGVAGLLLLSGLCHLALPNRTERIMSRVPAARTAGGLLLLLALPCLWWRGWYFRTLFVLLAISGLWRLGFPQSAIHAQQRSYPRRIHGGLLIGGAALVWALRP